MFDFRSKKSKRNTFLFIFAGLAFLTVAAVREIPALYGVGAVFLVIGASYIKRPK